MKGKLRIGLVILLVLSFFACSSGGSGGVADLPAGISKTIDSEGGVIELEGKKGEILEIEIPEDALSIDTDISILLVDDPNGISMTDSLFPTVVLGPDGTTFNKPVYLTFEVSDEILQGLGINSLDEVINYLNVYYWNGEAWEPSTIYDSDGKTVIVEINHFSEYKLVLDWYRISEVEILSPVKQGEEFSVKVTGDSRYFNGTDSLKAGIGLNFSTFFEIVFMPASIAYKEFSVMASDQVGFEPLVIRDSGNRILWEQEIGIDYDTDVFNDYYTELIEEYCPILVFGKWDKFPWDVKFPNGEEIYFPTRMEDALEDSLLSNGRFSKIEIDNPIIDDLARMGDENFKLSFNGERKTESDREKLIYATAVDEGDLIYLQYWFYYHYDPKDRDISLCYRSCEDNLPFNLIDYLMCCAECRREDPRSLQFLSKHHGDFESITVVLKKNGQDIEEQSVAYGQHLSKHLMGYSALNYQWTNAGVKVPWQNVNKEGKHPYVYVALGSHGCYPRKGVYAVNVLSTISVVREYEDYEEKAGGGKKWWPGDYSIEYLPRLSYIYPDSPYWESKKFLLFSGLWGNNLGIEIKLGDSIFEIGVIRLMTHHDKWINLPQWINSLSEFSFEEFIPNNPPIATIFSPSNDSVFTEGDSISFSGTGMDNEDGQLFGDYLIWTSDKDGQIGTGESFSLSDLSANIHSITLTVTDSEGETDDDSVTIQINPLTSFSMLTPRAWLGSVVFNNLIYTIGGGTGLEWFGYSETSIVEVYDVSNSTWVAKSSLIEPRFGLGVCQIGNKIYALGGTYSNRSQPMSSLEEYNISTDTWTIKTYLPTPRWKLTAAIVGGRIYAIGGSDNGNQITSTHLVEEYDLYSTNWTNRPSLPTARWGAANAVIGGNIYVMGGASFDIDTGIFSTPALEVYDAIEHKWSIKEPLNVARWDLAAAAVNGKIYAFGGMCYHKDTDTLEILQAVEEYDPASNTWTVKSPLPEPRTGLSAVAVNDRIYVLGGFDGTEIVEVVGIYNPITDTWLSN